MDLGSGDRRAERAARRRRADAERRVSERRASRPAGLSGGALPPLVRQGQVSRVGTVRFLAACALVCVVAAAGAVATTPLAGGQWRTEWAVVAALAVAGAGYLTVRVADRVGRRVRVGATVGAAVFAVLFAWGAASQIVVGGAPQLHTSDTARAYRLVEQLVDDLYRMSEYDVLLGYDDATSRANLREFDPAADTLEAIAARWATTEIASLPDGRFGPILRHVYTSADFGAQALRRKRALTLQFDPRTAAEVDSFRATYIRELLTAGPLLAELAAEYDFDLVPREGGAVE
jgi:hypothetical protein